MRGLAWLAVSLVAACGTASTSLPDDADAAPVDASVADASLPQWQLTTVSGRSVAKILVTPERVLLLEETVKSFFEATPGPRQVRAIDRRDFSQRNFTPEAPLRIGDLAVHPSGAVSLTLVEDDNHVTLIRLDAELHPVTQTLLVDPQAATDPPADPFASPDLLANGFTAEAARVVAVGEDALVSVFTSRNSLLAYRVALEGGALTTRWRSLVEPGSGLQPFLPIGGSFDTFNAISGWFHPALTVDELGNAYLAMWAAPSRIAVHNFVFGDTLERKVTEFGFLDSDVIVTKLDSLGRRQWSRVVGTRFEDEPYAIAAAGDHVVVGGRARQFPGNDNRQWNPWVAELDATGAARGDRALAFDALGIVLSVDVDADGTIVAGGSDGWTQNPEGLSILSFGAKLLFTLDGVAADPARLPLGAGPRHNEIRSVVLTEDGLWFAGHEDGPLTHSGDADRGQIHSDGVVGFVPR